MAISDTINSSLNGTVLSAPLIPPSAAYNAWLIQRGNYRRWWDWYSGDALLKVDPTAEPNPDGSPAYFFPIRVNPIQWICSKHVSALFGEVPDQADSMVGVSFLNAEGREDADSEKLTDVMNTIWSESNAREIMVQNATISQFMGGCFYRVKWDPTNPLLTYGIKFEAIQPDYVLPIYDTNDFWTLNECYIMYWITPAEAKLHFDVVVDANMPRVLYSEHWTKDFKEIQIGGANITYRVGDVIMSGKEKNPFGFVPVVYIPHPPRAGTFYGTGHVDEVSGLIEELNRRLADYGDLIQDTSHRISWMRNVTHKLSYQQISSNLNAIDLGNRNMTTQAEPEMGTLDVPVTSGDSHNQFVERLLDLIDRSAHLSPVAYGEDEGSQRSGVTLATRMWPLASHIRNERSTQTQGFRLLMRMAIRIMNSPQFRLPYGDLISITPAMMKLRAQIQWYSMLPLDRQAIVDEVVQRMGVNAISPEAAVEKLSDGGDDVEELQRIRAWAEFQNELDIKLAKAKPAQAGGF